MGRNHNAAAYQKYKRARAWVDSLERHLLGGAILDATGFMATDIVGALHEQDFTSSLHRALYRAIHSLLGRGARDLDGGLIIAELQWQGTFTEYPNAATYLGAITEGVVPSPSRESRLFRLHELAWAWGELERAKKEAVSG